MVSITSVLLPSSLRCGNLLPTEQLYTVTLPHRSRYERSSVIGCRSASGRRGPRGIIGQEPLGLELLLWGEAEGLHHRAGPAPACRLCVCVCVDVSLYPAVLLLLTADLAIVVQTYQGASIGTPGEEEQGLC